MAERKNTEFERPGGYATPRGAMQVQAKAARELADADIRLPGDSVAAHEASSAPVEPAYRSSDPDTRLYIGDCRDVLPNLPDRGEVDLVFADPPFNWDVPYDEWADGMPRAEFERFTYDWLDACVDCLAPHGSIWVNIPDDTAAEIVMHLKRRGLSMVNWCVWHFRFGQHRDSSFIMSKVHALYFARDPANRRWNPDAVLEQSDRAAIYNDPRTQAKSSHAGMRVPMDVWYGPYWGRVQGNNKNRHRHHNQIPEVHLERVVLACRTRATWSSIPSAERHDVHRRPGMGPAIDHHRVRRGQRRERQTDTGIGMVRMGGSTEGRCHRTGRGSRGGGAS